MASLEKVDEEERGKGGEEGMPPSPSFLSSNKTCFRQGGGGGGGGGGERHVRFLLLFLSAEVRPEQHDKNYESPERTGEEGPLLSFMSPPSPSSSPLPSIHCLAWLGVSSSSLPAAASESSPEQAALPGGTFKSREGGKGEGWRQAGSLIIFF